MNRKGIFVFTFILACSLLTGCEDNQWPSTSVPSSSPLSAPTAPENLQLEATGPSHVKLTWTASSTTQSGFIIHRSDDGSGYTQIGAVPPFKASFVDDGVSPDVTYIYRVYAANASGQSNPATSEQYHHPYFDACTSPTPTQTGPLERFYDFPVSGLNYSSAATYSITDNNGSFAWDKITDIHFSLGYIDLGFLRPWDKVGLNSVARNLGGDFDITLNNLLRLFIALDKDGDATNGIQLPCQTSLAYGQINFTLDYVSFGQQETVYRLTGGTPLPSAQEARITYEQTLYRDYTGHYELSWSAVIGGMIPVGATIPFDLDINGTIYNTGESVIRATVDAHNNYHMKIIDLAALLLINLGYYEIEISAYIRPDKTIDGEVTLKSVVLGNTKGTVRGQRVY